MKLVASSREPWHRQPKIHRRKWIESRKWTIFRLSSGWAGEARSVDLAPRARYIWGWRSLSDLSVGSTLARRLRLLPCQGPQYWTTKPSWGGGDEWAEGGHRASVTAGTIPWLRSGSKILDISLGSRVRKGSSLGSAGEAVRVSPSAIAFDRILSPPLTDPAIALPVVL